MKNNNLKTTSLFERSMDTLQEDPLEEIFALNLGDFLVEHLISEELAEKIGQNVKDKNEKLKEQLNELISIYSIDNTLSLLGFNNKEDYIIYNSIAKTIKQMVDFDDVHIFLNKEHAQGLENELQQELILVGTSINLEKDFYSYNIGYKIENKSSVVDAYKTLKTQNLKSKFDVKELNGEKTEVVIAIPMANNTECVGVIVITNYSDRNMPDEYLKLIQSTAKLFVTSMSLQKLTTITKQLIDSEDVSALELQNQRAQLTAMIGDLSFQQQEFVEILAKAVDKKGNYQEAHSEKAAYISKKLCEKLELNEKTSDLIYYAALLQNIGKITLNENLFQKTSKLSKEEWEKLQNHPNVGVNLLMNINFLSEVIPYIHYHKERWDGKGEPEGLKGYSIPFGSRIIAVADAFCALTSKRAFREALSVDKALDILKSEANIKWDPVVIDAICSINLND